MRPSSPVRDPLPYGECAFETVASLLLAPHAPAVALANVVDKNKNKIKNALNDMEWRELQGHLSATSLVGLRTAVTEGRRLPAGSLCRLRRLLRLTAAGAVHSRLAKDAHAGDARDDAKTSGRSVRCEVVDALLDMLGMRALLLVHAPQSDEVGRFALGRAGGHVAGAILFRDAHFCVAEEEGDLVAAIDAADPIPDADRPRRRLRCAADREAMMSNAVRRHGDREAANNLVAVYAFDVRGVTRRLRGGGRCLSKLQDESGYQPLDADEKPLELPPPQDEESSGKWTLTSWLQGAGVHRVVAAAFKHAIAEQGLSEDDAADHSFVKGLGSRSDLKKLLRTNVMMEGLIDLVWTEVETLKGASATSQDIQSKFAGATELSYGGLDTFFGGIEAVSSQRGDHTDDILSPRPSPRLLPLLTSYVACPCVLQVVGSPNPKLLKAMAEEHKQGPGDSPRHQP